MNVKDEKGFTLIEIMVVVVILGVLAGMVVPKLMNRPDEAKQTKAAMQIQSLGEALALYRLDNGFYPSSEQGLNALVEKPVIGKIPKKYRSEAYIGKVPKDPWGNEYQYLSPGRHGDYDLFSMGADSAIGGEGKGVDIESWSLE